MVPNPDAEQWGPHQLLSMAARLVQRRQDQALAELGLTHAAVIALQGLVEGPLNQEELAADIKVRSQSIGRVLVRLEAAGLVARESSSLDRRHNEVSITEAGRQALEAARKAEQDALPPDVVEGTVLSRELARVISYFPGRAKAVSGRNQDPAADDAAEADSLVAGAPTEGAALTEAAPTEGAPTEGVQQASNADTSVEPAEAALPAGADEVAAQDSTQESQGRAGTGHKPNASGDTSPN